MNDILFDLHGTPKEDLWSGNQDPPPDFIGVLWLAVHKAWKDQPGMSKKNNADEVDRSKSQLVSKEKPHPPSTKISVDKLNDVSKGVSTQPFTLQYILNKNNEFMINMDEYFTLMQDRGVEIARGRRPKNMYVPKVANMKNRVIKGYPKLHELSSWLYDVIKDNPITFSKLPKNKCNVITRIGKWLFDNREGKKFQ